MTVIGTGIRTSPFNIEEADSYRNKRYASKYNQSGGSVIQALKYKPLWQLQYRLASAEKKRKKTFDEWVEYAESSTDAGVENVYGNLVEHIGNKQLAKDVFLNRYRPYKPSKATLKWLQRKWRRAKTPQDKEELETRIKGFLSFF